MKLYKLSGFAFLLVAAAFGYSMWVQRHRLFPGTVKPDTTAQYASHPCAYVGKEFLGNPPRRWAIWAHDIKLGKADAAEISKLDCELDYINKVVSVPGWGRLDLILK